MGSAAVKVLKLPQGTERYDRFAQEVRVHLEVLRDCPGVLPLLEAEVPTADVIETAPWLAMPIAQPLASHLGRNRQPRVVIDHIISIGSTLAFLLEQHGVSHRDIKPENLYWVDGRAAVGDFGLVEVPGGRGLSRDDRDLGPRDLLAPEMRAGSTSRQGPPADVFSLGMTAFLLIAGTAPRDGLRRDERTHHLAELLNDHSLRELDRILQRATAYRSEERLSMATLVRELEAWASPPQRQKGVLDTSGVQLRIEALRASPLTDARVEERKRDLDEIQARLDLNAKPTFAALNQLGLEVMTFGVRLFERFDRQGFGLRTGSSLTFQPPAADGAVWVGGGVAHGVGEDDTAHVFAGWAVAGHDRPPLILWSRFELVELGSIRGLQLCDELVDEWASQAPDVIEAFLHRAERFAAVAATYQPASEPDRDPPELLSLSFDLRPVGREGATEVIAIARLRDAVAGVAGSGYSSSSSQIRLRGPGDETRDLMLSADGNRVSGTRFDGWYEGIARLEPFHQRGLWKVEYVLVADQAGHSRYIYQGELAARNVPTEIRIT